MAAKHKTHLEIMIIFCFLRIIESQALTLLCGDKDVRYRFLRQALDNGWVKENSIQKRERTTHSITLFSLTKKGLMYVCQSSSASLFMEMADIATSLSIFQKDEYGDDAKLRLAGVSTATVMALEGGASIPVEVFNRRYSFTRGEDDLLDSEDESSRPDTLREYFHRYLTEDKYVELGLFGADEYYNGSPRMCFFDSLFVKQALSGTNNPKDARDFYKGRFRGIIQSASQVLLVYTAPPFGMSWADWVVKPELSAIMRWQYRFASKSIKTARKHSALLIAKNMQQLLNLYRDVDHIRKDAETIGGRFDHLYVLTLSTWGVATLCWLMGRSDEDILDTCLSVITGLGLGEINNQPSCNILHYQTSDGREAMCGLLIDIKTTAELEHWARTHPEKDFVIFTMPDLVQFYCSTMPPNVECIVLG